jgi:hypothetical protein
LPNLTITLAGIKYEIQPLTIGQLEALHVGVVEPQSENPQESARQLWKRNIGIIVSALSIDYPHMTPEKLATLRVGSFKDVTKIVDSILVFSGLIDEKPKEPVPGEGEASAA